VRNRAMGGLLSTPWPYGGRLRVPCRTGRSSPATRVVSGRGHAETAVTRAQERRHCQCAVETCGGAGHDTEGEGKERGDGPVHGTA
jgi:hypothetical protein